MKSALKSLVYQSLSGLDIPRRLHYIGYRNQASILMYHGVTEKKLDLFDWCMLDADSFRQQIHYLNKYFRIVPLSDIATASGSRDNPKPPAAITFDDGYQNNFDVAFPILAELNIPFTIFLTTGFIGSDSTIWTGEIYHLFNETSTPSLTWRERQYDIRTNEGKLAAAATIKRDLKNTSLNNIHEELTRLETLLEVDNLSIDREHPYRILDANSIDTMQQSGLVEFGAHTVNHPILSQLKKEEQHTEITQSINHIASITGKDCHFFAYPNGTTADYNRETTDIVSNLGLEAALATTENMFTEQASQWEWPRFGIGADMDFGTFKMTIHGTRTKFRGHHQ